MAILNKIRQKTVVLILVIALALFAFILSGLVDNKDALFSKSPNTVATVNGKDISREAFMAVVESQKNPNTTTSQVMNRVYDAQVRKIVMESQFDVLGLSVGREQMIELLKPNLANSPDFQNEAGLFDEAKLNTYIANLKDAPNKTAYNQWVDYETNVSGGALQQTYFNLVKAGTTATLAEGALEHKLEGDKVNIKFVQVPFTSIVDSTVAVSKSEISAYINKNKKKYEVEASRNLQYVQFSEVASVDDEVKISSDLAGLLNDTPVYNAETKTNDTIVGFKTTKNIEAFVSENSDSKFVDKYVYSSGISKFAADSIFTLNVGDVYGPYKDAGNYKMTRVLDKKQLADSIQSSHIIIPFIGSQNAGPDVTRTKEDAKKIADSIFKLVRNNKTKYAEVANEINTDASKGKDGSIGWTRLSTYNPAAFDPDFANFLFFNKKGSIEVVGTKFGYHIIRIDDKKNVDTALRLATIERKIEPSTETEAKIFRDAANFELATGKQSFQEAATANNYTVRPVNGMKLLDENIPGVGSQRQIVKWTYEAGVKVGDVKQFPVPGGFIVAQITAINEAGLMNETDASVTALPAVRKEKKAKLIRDRVKATTLEDFASAEGQTVKSASAINMKNPTIAGAGKEPLVVGTAFGLAEGATSKLVTGENGVYMVQVTKITPAVELDNYQSFANQVGTQKLNAVNTRLYNALKEAAEIEDNRANTVQ